MTAIKREGSSETIEVQFYVKENNTVVSASKASATLNQLTPSALSQRVKFTVCQVFYVTFFVSLKSEFVC